MISFVFTADYGMGIGDFLVKLYAICHLTKHIRDQYQNIHYSLILEEYQTDVLSQILNTSFFSSFFDHFEIIHSSDTDVVGLGTNVLRFNHKTFYRVFSAINDLTNNNRGYWEVYSDHDRIDLSIPYSLFDYRDPSSRNSKPIPDYNLLIFNQSIFDEAKAFAKLKLSNNFSSVYYRALSRLDHQHLHRTTDTIVDAITRMSDRQYLITTNSVEAQQYLLSKIKNAIIYPRDTTHTSDGYGTAASDAKDISRLVTEMIVMSYGHSILYAGNHSYISLYNYYPHMVRGIPLIHYQ